MILFFTTLSILLVLNLLLLVFSVNKTNKNSSSDLNKVYFKPSLAKMKVEEGHQYSIS
ncbi:hypothetical protein SAMN05216480_101864 [Pustulibacterium marinum]|uniref:Uncharacterized protein n=1 Tax=Pustulibacterium marinum TaxID=1224947 RepID=A0A1I7FCW5_9FLAO|nr:hypothetical protein SAMN05216480_101864 [Pustulibacterium marinum]